MESHRRLSGWTASPLARHRDSQRKIIHNSFVRSYWSFFCSNSDSIASGYVSGEVEEDPGMSCCKGPGYATPLVRPCLPMPFLTRVAFFAAPVGHAQRE